MNPASQMPFRNRTASLAGLVGLVLALILMAAALRPDPAMAIQTIESFSTTSSTQQAGGHPDLTTSFTLADPGAPEAARNIEFNAPEGIFGNPNAITRCQRSDFAQHTCPPNSQAGVITLRANVGGDPEHLLGTAPIYSLSPEEHQTALFGLIAPQLDIPILIPVAVRTTDDYGLRFTVSEISQNTPLRSVDLTFWGFPAEGHNAQRFPKGSPGNPPNCPELEDTSCITSPTPSSEPPSPLTSNPTICTGQPLVSRLTVQSYQDPDNRSHAEDSYEPVTGCDRVTFSPVMQGKPTTKQTDSASGLDLVLSAPQFLGFAAQPAQIRRAIITLPPGLTINPDAADGQTMCTDAQAKFHSEGPAACPDNAKIGTFEIASPALDGPLTGSLYIGEPKPGNQYRVFMMASGFGINAKLISNVIPDPATGQVRIHTQELPQVSFDEFKLHLFASDRGLMATPTHCSVYAVEAQFFPWNDDLADQTSTQFFNLDSGPEGKLCPPTVRPFTPRLVAGSSNPVAGEFSDFALKLDRDDGDQFLGDLNFLLPPGFTGDLKGISYCPEANIAAATQTLGRVEQVTPSCPASSLVGSSNVAAGPGSHPFHAVGKMYLAGPLKGAPLSLVAITPALAGPYDYGNVVVRVALHINPLTAQVRAESERMPQIIGGIPIRMRSIRVSIDRPNFTINPTNCSAMSVDSQGIGDQGGVAAFSSYFNVVDCTRLRFGPRMSVRQLGRRGQTLRSKNPKLQFNLRTRPGEANIRSLAVTLPKSFAIDQRRLGNICSKSQLEAELCAGRQPIGTVMTWTPLLDQPLTGPAYAVSGFGKLPRLAFILRGQVTLIPQARSASVKGGFLRTVVPVIPDAPIGHFRLTLLGGSKGYLVNTRNLCERGPGRITVQYRAHNGRRSTQRLKPKVPCGKGKKNRRAKRSNHAR